MREPSARGVHPRPGTRGKRTDRGKKRREDRERLRQDLEMFLVSIADKMKDFACLICCFTTQSAAIVMLGCCLATLGYHDKQTILKI